MIVPEENGQEPNEAALPMRRSHLGVHFGTRAPIFLAREVAGIGGGGVVVLEARAGGGLDAVVAPAQHRLPPSAGLRAWLGLGRL